MALPGMDPAFGCQPEWPGQQSGKFTEPRTGYPIGRRIVETNIRNGDSASLARNGFGQFASDTRGLLSSEGKKISPMPGSEVFEWRPSRRPISQPGCEHFEKPEGRSLAEPAPGKALGIREKRHVRQVESKEEHSDRPVGPRAVVRENGYRAADQPAREVDITYEMQRKVPHYSLHDQRSGIGCKSYGDKAYKHPEYSDRFYQMGQLVVGAGFARGHFKKTEPRNAMALVPVEVERKVGAMTFEEKEAKELKELSELEAEELTKKWEGSVLVNSDAARAEVKSCRDAEKAFREARAKDPSLKRPKQSLTAVQSPWWIDSDEEEEVAVEE